MGNYQEHLCTAEEAVKNVRSLLQKSIEVIPAKAGIQD